MSKEVELQLSIKKTFGPPIGKTAIPNSIIDRLNAFVDKEIDKSLELSKKLDFGNNLAGQVKQEIRIPNEIVEPDLLSFFLNISKHYVKLGCDKNITKFQLLDTWVVRQFENEYNPIHFHGGHLSGAGYIKLPDSFGSTPQQNKKSNPNGHIVFQHGVKQFLSNGHQSYEPKLGDFYIFPNYLYHSVNPFFGPGERRSISFNAIIDNEIYDVYT